MIKTKKLLINHREFFALVMETSFTHRSVKSFTMATGPKQSLVEKRHGDYMNVVKVKRVIVSVVYKSK